MITMITMERENDPKQIQIEYKTRIKSNIVDTESRIVNYDTLVQRCFVVRLLRRFCCTT